MMMETQPLDDLEMHDHAGQRRRLVRSGKSPWAQLDQDDREVQSHADRSAARRPGQGLRMSGLHRDLHRAANHKPIEKDKTPVTR